MRRKTFYILSFILILSTALATLAAPRSAQTRAITVVTEPGAGVWLDDVKYGVTDKQGRLTINTVAPGARRLKVRAFGFKEVVQPLAATQRGEVRVALVKATDAAEIAFQEAEKMLGEDKEKAVTLYEKAVKLNPRYAEAYVAMARALTDIDPAAALKAVAGARRARPGYPEASAVEGRIHKSDGNEEKAIASFKRAITEGKGFMPEAHAGLGLLYKEKGEGSIGSGDTDSEEANFDLAFTHLKTAIKQLSGAPDAEGLYQVLGVAYEKEQKFTEAIALYEEFLRVFPNSSEASAVRSFIVQIKKQMQ